MILNNNILGITIQLTCKNVIKFEKIQSVTFSNSFVILILIRKYIELKLCWSFTNLILIISLQYKGCSCKL